MWPPVVPLPRTLEACLRDLEDPKPQVRASALSDLSLYCHDDHRETVARALLKALSDENAEVRAKGADLLGDLRCVEANASLLALVEDANPIVRQMAVQALGDIGDPRSTARLRRALEDERPEVRFQAIIAFPKVAPEDSIPVLIHALEDGDPYVRYIALRVAEEHLTTLETTRSQTHQQLIKAIEEKLDDTDSSVICAAALFLVHSKHSRAEKIVLKVVRGALRPSDPQDEAHAIELVGDLGLREAIPALETRAFGMRRFVREEFPLLALTSLAKLGHARAVETILNDLDGWSRQTRTLAVMAVGKARLQQAKDRLLAMREDERRVDQFALYEALQALGVEQPT